MGDNKDKRHKASAGRKHQFAPKVSGSKKARGCTPLIRYQRNKDMKKNVSLDNSPTLDKSIREMTRKFQEGKLVPKFKTAPTLGDGQVDLLLASYRKTKEEDSTSLL
jgi:hypothetical protein